MKKCRVHNPISFTGSIAVCIVIAVMLSSCGGGGGGGDGKGVGGVLSDIGDAITGSSSDAKPSISQDDSLPDRDPTPKVLTTEASGEAVFQGKDSAVDYSHADEGYIMAQYTGDNQKVKVQVIFGTEDAYTYDMPHTQDFVAFPLSRGAGEYDVKVLANIEATKYSTLLDEKFNAEITNPMSPFLHPNEQVEFTASSKCVAQAQTLATGDKTDDGVVESVFLWIIQNVVYDYDKAQDVTDKTLVGYISDPDETLATKKGICLDYASLMSAMLRSQGIPCQLIVGYAGTAYHAWVAVYSNETGKVANIYEFTNNTWNRMDPTFIAGVGGDASLLGDGETYNPLYYY